MAQSLFRSEAEMRPNSRYQFAIATICALALEAEAVEAAFDETYDRLCRYYGKQQGDSNWCVNGRVGKHNVALCYMPEYWELLVQRASPQAYESSTRASSLL
ncbi:Fungal specific transcription factor domain family protein [Aspergillus niger]|uniref:Fungal specific transcription factor domain family protein n=1 Tax=Aspergillus niger TaxID=5061 RepID=A0A505I0F6_ASPNG|nr:Fungal specific transcription factor domain family protein [Aspergillus niger]